MIPTAEIVSVDLTALPTGERNILYLIAARLLCAVGEPHTYAETAVTLECGGVSFTTKGRTVTAAGWKGLGTPATRAGIIEKLVRSDFAERKKKQLIPTEKGLALSWAMPDQLKSAKLTAEWENRLGAVERGELAPEDFMAGITAMLSDLVRSYQNVNVSSAAPCPYSRTEGRAGQDKPEPFFVTIDFRCGTG